MKCVECGKEVLVYEDRHDYKVVDFKNGSAVVKCNDCLEEVE